MQDNTASNTRYQKITWSEKNQLPSVGKSDYFPKSQSFRKWEHGTFKAEFSFEFPVLKEKKKLSSLDKCAFCGRSKNTNGEPINLTSEHIIPEFLGAGLELKNACCVECQKTTSKFESSIANEIFGPFRKSIRLKGKNGIIRKGNFENDIGCRETKKRSFSIEQYPTILTLPSLFPASVYSRKPLGSGGIFNFRTFNINVNKHIFKKLKVANISSQHIDIVRFCQLIAKISHIAVVIKYPKLKITPLLTDFIQKDFEKTAQYSSHYKNIGGFFRSEPKSSLLHEVDVGKIEWKGEIFIGARVRLFACYDMPDYYVAVGRVAK